MDATGWHWLHGVDAAEVYACGADAYRALWNSINGAGSWDTNPWVIAYTFTVHRQNIDHMAITKEAAA